MTVFDGLFLDRYGLCLDWPVHQPAAPDAPIPGGPYWYGGCSPDYGRVNPDTGVCMDCGETACPECGREDCPDHGDAA